jgi:hypothetical protein
MACSACEKDLEQADDARLRVTALGRLLSKLLSQLLKCMGAEFIRHALAIREFDGSGGVRQINLGGVAGLPSQY